MSAETQDQMRPEHGDRLRDGVPSRGRLPNRRSRPDLVALSEAAVRSPVLAYGGILALQLHVLWGIWKHKDVTTGDTASYFLDAVGWAHGLTDNIVWSPLYTAFFGTFVALIHDVPLAVEMHRLVIVLAAAVLVLAVARALLGPALGLLVAVWWTVLPPNFNVEYEVHLYGLLPILVAVLVVARRPGVGGRAAALGILVATTLLLRNELIVAAAIFGAAVLVIEIREQRAVARPARTYLRTYGIAVLVVVLITLGAYERSTVKGHQAQIALSAKQDLNTCQVYAFTYQQRHPARFPGSPWTDCSPLMQRTFGRPLPGFTQAARANPGAIASFVGWNGRLLASGLQVSLFGATSTGDTPGFFPVRKNRLYALLLSIAALGVILAGLLATIRGPRGLRRALAGRLVEASLLASVSVTALLVALTERPRPEYLYGLTVTLLIAIGACVLKLLGLTRLVQFAAPAALATLIVLVVAVPSAYSPRPRPLHDAIERLQVVKHQLQQPGSVLVAAGYNYELCAYLAASHVNACTSPSWSSIEHEAKDGTTLPEALQLQRATAIYATAAMISDPALATLTADPSSGWRRIASGTGTDGPWSILVAASTRHPQGQTVLELPRDLTKPGLRPVGIYRDGWSQQAASLTLPAGPAGVAVLRGAALPLPSGRLQRLRLFVDGHEVASRTVGEGPFSIEVDVPSSARRRLLELRWSESTRIGPNDPRRGAALLQSVGVVSSAAPTKVDSFPDDLSAPGLHPVGVYADGWMRANTRVTLAGGRAGTLVLRANVPPQTGQQVTIRVDGTIAASRRPTTRALEIRIPVAASSHSRRVALHWARASRIAANDPRVAAAQLEFLGIFARPAPPRAPAPVANGNFENGTSAWTEVDTGKAGLSATTQPAGSARGAVLRLTEADASADDYYVYVARRLSPNATYVVSALVRTPRLRAEAIAGRGLFAIARSRDAYDGATSTTASITSPKPSWERQTVSVKTGPGDDSIEIRLYAPQGVTEWDGAQITLMSGRPAVAGAGKTIPRLKASLSSKQVIPPLAQPVNGAAGSFQARLTNRTTLHWSLHAAGLSGSIIAATIRSGATGATGDKLIVLCEPCTSPAHGAAALSDAAAALIASGKTYVNVGTASNPYGEIRGQIEPGQ